MNSPPAAIWPQPLSPVDSDPLSVLLAAIPLLVILLLMAGFRKSSLFSSACGLAVTTALALFVWGMPLRLAAWSLFYGSLYSLWPIMWIVFAGLWLYNLTLSSGQFELLRGWMAHHASGDPCVQALLVAFCFGALLESCAGFGAPVAVTAFLLARLGFKPWRAVVAALIANTAPVGFGGMGIPIVALNDVTHLDVYRLSAMVGRQLPVLSFLIPVCLVWVAGGAAGLKRVWPAMLITGGSYAITQFLVSNFWGPYAADIMAASVSTGALVGFLRFWRPTPTPENLDQNSGLFPTSARSNPHPVSPGMALAGWMPWLILFAVMMAWSSFRLTNRGTIRIPIPLLHNGILRTVYEGTPYQGPYPAIYTFRPLEVGTAVVTAMTLTAVFYRLRPRMLLESGARTLVQVRLPAQTVMLIIGLASLYNYSGMAYTLGAAMARVGRVFPILSSYLGWVGCLVSGSDAASNVLFGNLQTLAAHRLHLDPVLLAATNSSGGVISKMISPQNIAVGVSTLGLVGQEGNILRRTFWPGVLLAALLGFLAYVQAYWTPWIIPSP